MTKTVTKLTDKYVQMGGRVYLNANQALVRLPLDQARRDRAAGLVTTGYISGYRGSPLGVYDAALTAAQELLDEHDIRFVPGLNEELAATAIRGTQELAWFGKSKFQGVFGLWYGKGVGVDRACESLKLGNLEGAAAKGGFLAVAGDDPGGKSSANASQSEHTLIAGYLPVLYPSNIREIIEYGLFGWAMSRYSGAYVGMKCTTDMLDLSASVQLPDIHHPFHNPADISLPAEGLNLRRNQTPLVQEDWMVNKRLPAAQAFVRANGLDKVILDSPRRTIGIVAAGKVYLDLRQGLSDLGLSEDKCQELGIRLYKPGMIWPLERQGALAFAQGSRVILVIEEKRPILEDQLARYLYSCAADQRPAIAGKTDLLGAPLLAQTGELNPALVRKALVRILDQARISDPEVSRRSAALDDLEGRALTLGGTSFRPAFFCSGCPHNTSTKIPDGSAAISAVGCHGLAAYVMPERNTMQPMPMGGDGMPWVSVGPLVEMPHIFQNMGDGTYAHSGILAIRQAVAVNANMTFKILYNDAVAMTGGQPVDASLTPLGVVNQLVAEGVTPVLLVSDDPDQYRGVTLPANVTVNHRDEMDRLQREIREVKGVSAILYEQTCATENRRRRKRGVAVDPDRRVFINPQVCEGCGDCSVQSNCVSILPLETEFGRKRMIDQSTCNKDYSCIKGFCPSFVTVEGASIARRTSADGGELDRLFETLPRPSLAPIGADGYNVLIAGIGGTGVLTLGALMGMAAHLEAKGCSILDVTGLAQKGGAVTSHIRVAAEAKELNTSRLAFGMADLILAADMIVGSGGDVLKTVKPGKTVAIVNRDVTPTGEFQTNHKLDLGEAKLELAISDALGGGTLLPVHGSRLATELTGDSIGTNVLMLGYAAQMGLLPVSIESLDEAIRLNGAFVTGNLRTLKLGRLAAHNPEAIANLLGNDDNVARLDTVEDVIASRVRMLTSYQNAEYARSYEAFVRDIARQLDAQNLEGSELFTREVALTLARLMSYKDEYEVARLHSDPEFWERLHAQFSGNFKVSFHLAPPMLPGKDAIGRPKKRTVGPWIRPVFSILKRGKVLRGTAFDPFGYSRERRTERRLIGEYRSLVWDIVARVTQANLDTSIELAGAAYEIRGFGPVKDASLAEYRERKAGLLKVLERKSMPEARVNA